MRVQGRKIVWAWRDPAAHYYYEGEPLLPAVVRIQDMMMCG